MKENLQALLTTRFANFFSYSHAYPGCGDGWFQILWNICSEVDDYIAQIKHHNQWCQDQIQAVLQGLGRFEKLSDEQRTAEIEKLNEDIKIIPLFNIVQIKEKFGTLRFYYDGGDKVIDRIVSMGERFSESTCEYCGKPGKLRQGGWLKTLCDEHAEGLKYKKAEKLCYQKGDTVYAVGKNFKKPYEIVDVLDDNKVNAKHITKGYSSEDFEYGDTEKLMLVKEGPIEKWLVIYDDDIKMI